MENKKTLKYIEDFKSQDKKTRYVLLGVLGFFVLAIIWIILTSATTAPEYPVNIEVEKGTGISEVAHILKENGVIRSKTIFTSLTILKPGKGKVVSGEYLFTKPENIFNTVKRLSNGDYGIETRKIRIPEGFSITQIAELFNGDFYRFDKKVFFELTEGKEGYLFPDTYSFRINVQAHEVVEKLEKIFTEKTADITGLNFTNIEEIIIMASIIEKEADKENRQEVSNILWHRLDIGMALQVDATFVYSINKGTFDLTRADLQDNSNLYNTYVHTGLPPTPIGNPGLESIKAAANPKPTSYLYFLTGRDGEFYYAETFEGHKKNKALHL